MRSCRLVRHVGSCGETAIGELHAVGVLSVDMVQSRLPQGRWERTGTQVVQSQWIRGFPAQVQGNAVKGDVGNAVEAFAVQQNSVFAFAEDVAETDTADSADRGVLFPLKHRDGDGLGGTPEHFFFEKPRVDADVVEHDILNGTFVPQLQGDAPVGVADDTVFDEDIAEYVLAFAAELDGCAGGGKCAVCDGDVLAGAVLHGGSGILEHNAVIRALNVAVGDADIAAVVGVDTVAVGHAQTVEDADAVNEDIAASDHMHSPECTVAQGDMLDGEVRYVFQKQHGCAGIEDALNVPAGHLAVEDVLVAVDSAEACDGEVFAILRVQEIVTGCAGVFAVFVRGGIAEHGGAVPVCKQSVIIQIIAAHQYGTHFKVKFQIGAQDQRTAAIDMSAGEGHPSAACAAAGVDSGLNGSCVRRNAITDGAEMQCVVFHKSLLCWG